MGACGARTKAIIGAALALAGAPAASEEPETQALSWRGDVTAGARLYFLESPFDDDLAGFFDRYRYIETKNDDPAWFADLFHLDLGRVREDGTYLFRLERASPEWENQRTRLDADWRGLELGVDYRRYRWSELRVYPEDTRGRFPTAPDNLAVRFNPDTPPDNPLGRDRTLWQRRQRVEGALSLRPEEFGWDARGARELKLRAWNEWRDGRRQDRFLLDDPREIGTSGALQRARFRGQRRELDQQVTGAEASVVLTPGDLFTASLRAGWERFREDAPTATVGELAASTPDLGTGFDEASRVRPLFFVPDTDRWSGSAELWRRAGPAELRVGGSLSYLEQSGRRSPLQRLEDVSDAEVLTGTGHAAVDLALPHALALHVAVKTAWRDNGFDRSDLAALAPPDGQVDAFLSERLETNLYTELTWRPVAGALVGAGVRSRYVDRDLDYADPPAVIVPPVALQNQRSESHTAYVRGRLRVAYGGRIEGELGYEHAPEVAFVRDLEDSLYFEGRATSSWQGRWPGSLAVFGRVRHGDNNNIRPIGETADSGRTKKFERTFWRYGATLQLLPAARVALTSTWVEQRDTQDFPHLRSTIPRYAGPAGLAFFRDARLDYESRLQSLIQAISWRPLDPLELRASSSLNWLHSDFSDGGRTARLLDDVNRIDARITSVDASAELALPREVTLGIGYRYDRFDDGEDLDPLRLDEEVHTASLWVRWSFGPQ